MKVAILLRLSLSTKNLAAHRLQFQGVVPVRDLTAAYGGHHLAPERTSGEGGVLAPGGKSGGVNDPLGIRIEDMDAGIGEQIGREFEESVR